MVHDPPVILVFTADPSLAPLGDALQGQGLAAVGVSTIEEGRGLVASYRERAVAVLDTSGQAPYPLDAVCELLHQSPPVPTLPAVPRRGCGAQRLGLRRRPRRLQRPALVD